MAEKPEEKHSGIGEKLGDLFAPENGADLAGLGPGKEFDDVNRLVFTPISALVKVPAYGLGLALGGGVFLGHGLYRIGREVIRIPQKIEARRKAKANALKQKLEIARTQGESKTIATKVDTNAKKYAEESKRLNIVQGAAKLRGDSNYVEVFTDFMKAIPMIGPSHADSIVTTLLTTINSAASTAPGIGKGGSRRINNSVAILGLEELEDVFTGKKPPILTNIEYMNRYFDDNVWGGSKGTSSARDEIKRGIDSSFPPGGESTKAVNLALLAVLDGSLKTLARELMRKRLLLEKVKQITAKIDTVEADLTRRRTAAGNPDLEATQEQKREMRSIAYAVKRRNNANYISSELFANDLEKAEYTALLERAEVIGGPEVAVEVDDPDAEP